MATITIRNVPDSLLKKLKEQAKLERRSVNNEIIKILEDASPGRKTRESFSEILKELGKDPDFTENVMDAYRNRSYGRDIKF